MLMEYQIQCEADELAFFNVTDLDIQRDVDCLDDKNNPKYVNMYIL